MNINLYRISSKKMLLIFLFFIILALQPVRSETTACTPISTIPIVISVHGIYCFTENLSTSMTSGSAITILANNVTIDMNGYKLGGLGAGDGTSAYGINAYQRKNITIRNGIIRGFVYGIYLNDTSPYTTSQGHMIEQVLADQNTNSGIVAKGRGITLRRNQIIDTGGGTYGSGTAYGIRIFGPGNRVLNNNVTTVISTSGTDQHAFGIDLYSANDAMLLNNRIVGIHADGSGISAGISTFFSDYVISRENVIVTADYGIYYGVLTGHYRDNVTENISGTKYLNGNDGGGNS